MKLADFDYQLPAELIAQEPITPRDASKLMAINCIKGTFAHLRFRQIDEFLKSGDVLVLNSTRVFPARLRGKKRSGGKVEVLLLNAVPGEKSWRALVRGAMRATSLEFPEGLKADMRRRLAEGEWELLFSSNHLRSYLEKYGEMPLPPYIKRPEPRGADVHRYQTVYAQAEGAVAAPTAGFHFTPDLLDRIKAKGVIIKNVILHVGWGTFRPVRVEKVEEHAMLAESYEVSLETADALNLAHKENRRVIAVGTTVVRTLETICDGSERFQSGCGEASLYIYPGYRFKAIDGLVTNFHLPDSTPLLLANAFYAHQRGFRSGASIDSSPFALRFAYENAIREKYRFYSYGDAMLLL